MRALLTGVIMFLHRLSRCVVPVVACTSLLFIAGCTTYTWPDGSQKTVIGVVPEDENKRYEEQQVEGVRYRVPDEIPE